MLCEHQQHVDLLAWDVCCTALSIRSMHANRRVSQQLNVDHTNEATALANGRKMTSGHVEPRFSSGVPLAETCKQDLCYDLST